MLFHRYRGCLLGAVACLLVLGASAGGDSEERADAMRAWRDVGRRLLFRLGTARGQSAEWLHRRLAAVDPNSPDAVNVAEFIVAGATDTYGRDTIVLQGRIPLDVHPQCILGLYAAERFPGATLGDWGRRQLRLCVEQACLIVMPAGAGDWQAWLEGELLNAARTPNAAIPGGGFTAAEAPYLYCYLAGEARSVAARHRARERLAGCLWAGYGLEPGLRQYVLLSAQGYRMDDAWRDGGVNLDRVGPHPAVKKLYEQRLTDANSLEPAQEACERLVSILLRECRYRQAGAALDLVSRRFGQAPWTTPQVQDFLQEFRTNALQTRRRLAAELAQATQELQALPCCRRLDALWTVQEAPGQWQTLAQELGPGSVAQQCARVFWAQALLRVGRAEAAVPLVGELAQGGTPFTRAQSHAISAAVAHAQGQSQEAVALYAAALQIDRPTSLPDWCQGLVTGLSADGPASGGEGREAQRLLFQGCHNLLDADYAGALDSLHAAAADFRLLPESQQRVLSCALMMACRAVEDYVEAEAWGYRALTQYQREHADDDGVASFLTRIQELDLALSQWVAAVRRQASDAASASALSEQAARVCDAQASLGMCVPFAAAAGKGLQQSYVEICRRRQVGALTEEYRYLSRQATHSGRTELATGSETLLFAAQVLGGESLDRIQENFASLAEGPEDRDRLHRFAGFALQANRPDLMRIAMDLAASESKTTADLNDVPPTRLQASTPGEEWPGSADAARTWRDLGTLLLTRSGTVRSPVTEWFDRQLDVADPNADEVVRSAEFLLMKVLDGYGQNAMAVAGRIPLDVHPQCILGLYAAERFPGTKVGQWGSRLFERCIEQACSVTMSGADTTWPERLEAELLAEGKTPDRSQQGGAFSWTERPYLYLYLGRTARSVDVRREATKRLAEHLGEQCGLEAGLRRRLVLLDEGGCVDGAWLEVATWLERIGFHRRAKEVYGQLIQKADTAEQARQAAEGLARILIAESRRREARSVLRALSERFPNVEWAAPDVRDLMGELQSNREEISRKLAGELGRTTKEFRLLQLCRLFDALWTVEEAPQRWRAFVDSLEAGSLAEQFGRVFTAKALLGAGKVDGLQAMVRGPAESVNPFLRAQSIVVLAEVARARGDTAEAARLYHEAAGIDRPTPLPAWFRGLVQAPPLDARTPAPELQAWTRFLKACNDLMDGDFAAAEDSLAPPAGDLRSLPGSLQRVLPCATALAYWGIGDYAEAEAWGFLALEEYRRDDPNDGGTLDLLAKTQEMDMIVCRLAAGPWDGSVDAPVDPTVQEQAMHLCDVGASLDVPGTPGENAGNGIRQLYVQAKKRQMARSLAGEYRWIRHRRSASGQTEHALDPEPLFFAAQVLGGDSFDRIRENFASVPEDAGVKDRMYRFLLFARATNRPELTRSALDVVAEQTSGADTEVLEDIARMYLEAASHQKAIAVYQKMAAAAATSPDKAKSARLKIIEIYAENMKNPGRAIEECEEFIRQYPDDPQTGPVEFLMGKLAYLNKDYAGAVGQLDGFRKRHPQHPEVGQAMLLAGLSRMAEGNTQDAIGRFTEVIRTYPDDDLAARSKFLIGYALVSEQRYADALEVFKQLVEQFPRSQYVPQARSMIERLSRVSR